MARLLLLCRRRRVDLGAVLGTISLPSPRSRPSKSPIQSHAAQPSPTSRKERVFYCLIILNRPSARFYSEFSLTHPCDKAQQLLASSIQSADIRAAWPISKTGN